MRRSWSPSVLVLWLAATIIILLMLCCGGTRMLPERGTPGTLGTRQIAGMAAYATAQQWQAAPWYRVSDAVMAWPVFVLIDANRHACLVSGRVWAIAQVGEFWPCPSGWRFPR